MPCIIFVHVCTRISTRWSLSQLGCTHSYYVPGICTWTCTAVSYELYTLVPGIYVWLVCELFILNTVMARLMMACFLSNFFSMGTCRNISPLSYQVPWYLRSSGCARWIQPLFSTNLSKTCIDYTSTNGALLCKDRGVQKRNLRTYIEYMSFIRSPRWTSGSPRMLLVLVRAFESRRGEILNLFAKTKKKDQLLRAPSVGKHHSTRVDEGRKSWNLLAIKMQGTNRSG